MPAFSIVVPAYNAECYLRACLDSLLSQSFDDFEVICVNDASTDGTKKIIAEYVESDTRFTMVENDRNMHLFASRHVGVKKSSGDWVLFLDSDDELTQDALERLFEHVSNDPVDILQFGMRPVVSPDSDAVIAEGAWYTVKYPPIKLKGRDIIRTVCLERWIDMCTHHRVYRGDFIREVFSELGYEAGLYGAEDIVEQMALMASAQTYECIEPEYYLYYQGRGLSGDYQRIAETCFEDHYMAKWRCYRCLIGYLEKNNLFDEEITSLVDSRWYQVCKNALGLWNYSYPVDGSDREELFRGFVNTWPKQWTYAALCEFIVDDASALSQRAGTDAELHYRKARVLANEKYFSAFLDRENCEASLDARAIQAERNAKMALDRLHYLELVELDSFVPLWRRLIDKIVRIWRS